jgi:hypothetical protein
VENASVSRSATHTVAVAAGSVRRVAATMRAARAADSGVAPTLSRPGGPAAARRTSARAESAQQDRAGVLEQTRAALGRSDGPSVQQRGTEVGLERCDVLRHRRLRVSELPRGGRERGEARHGDERPEEARSPISIRDGKASNDRWT